LEKEKRWRKKTGGRGGVLWVDLRSLNLDLNPEEGGGAEGGLREGAGGQINYDAQQKDQRRRCWGGKIREANGGSRTPLNWRGSGCRKRVLIKDPNPKEVSKGTGNGQKIEINVPG